MSIDKCLNRISRHINSKETQPLIVDVQNPIDFQAILDHFKVGNNEFVDAYIKSHNDRYPKIDELLHKISTTKGNVFVTGLSPFLKLKGESVTNNILREILNMNTTAHIVVITFQCSSFLKIKDPRLSRRIFILEGEPSPIPTLVFCTPDTPVPSDAIKVFSLNEFAVSVESHSSEKLYIVTEQSSNYYPDSLFPITDLKKVYDLLLSKDPTTKQLPESLGDNDQWKYAWKLFSKHNTWADVIDAQFNNHQMLEFAIPNYSSFDDKKKWLFFIGLKLFGSQTYWSLDYASQNAGSYTDLAKYIYRSILEINHDDKNYKNYYYQRKILLNQLGNPLNDAVEFCNIVKANGKYAIYYLTDNTQKERDTLFEVLDQYGTSFDRQELISILSIVYPDLYKYALPYRFKQPLLNEYFQDYKYQKIINTILPEFEAVVEEQAKKREYNYILDNRASVLDDVDKDSQLYFIDAMGVEYLAFIVAVSQELELLADITVCHSEIPSLTSENKEFLSYFENVVSIKDLDEIKHHGENDFNYENVKTPNYLSTELAIIRDVLTKIRTNLLSGSIKKAVIISDHGASRLAVLHNTETLWEMPSKGEHSGRCCLKTELDTPPEFAVDAGNYWALANYDRFKGGRKANVEVHGGATLEEVVIPIIELSLKSKNIEVFLLPVDVERLTGSRIPEIKVSYKKKASIKIYTSVNLKDVSICINNKYYDATPVSSKTYIAEMPDLRKAGIYSVDVYSGNNLVASDLELKISKEGSSEKSLF